MKRGREEGKRLFVGNLSYETDAAALKSLFARFGTVVDCHVPQDGDKSRGFGFVTMSLATEARAAMEADGTEVDGRTIRVDEANDKRPVWGRPDLEDVEPQVPDADAEKPNFGLSGALAKDETTGNVYKGHVLKWTEPDDAARPNARWRIYVFKDDAVTDTLHIHRQSAFLVGRIKAIADILTMHPSCSGQHAVIQFRAKTVRVDGDDVRLVLPYVMDLGSTNGTFLNGSQIEAARYIELRQKDVLRFGSSSRDYVILRDDAAAVKARPTIPL